MTEHNLTDQAQEAILEAAAQVFAAHGYAGARVEAIAQAAGINKAMLYYRVGGKAKLYELVVLRLFDRLARALEQAAAPADPADPAAIVERVLHVLAELFTTDPRLPRIMSWELASGGRHLPESVLAQWGRILGVMMPLAERAGTDPACAYFAIAGSMVFHFLTKPMRMRLAQVLPPELAHVGTSDAWDMARFLVTISRKAMEARP